MKFSVNTHDLRNAMVACSAVALKNTSRPILTAVKLVATDKLIIDATNMEQRIACKIEDVEVEVPGQICVMARMLLDYLKEVTHEKITIEFLGDLNHLRLSSGQSRIHLNVMDPTCFPDDTTQQADFFNVDGDKLIKTLKKIHPFASSDETRVHLTSVCIAPGELVATDGHRMSIVTDEAFEIANQNLLIPRTSVPIITKLLAGEESINVALGNNTLFFQAGNTLFSTRLISKDYPNYQALLPKTPMVTVKGNREEFLHAIKRLLLVHKLDSTSRSSLIKFEFTLDHMALSATSTQMGEAAELLEVTGFEDGSIRGFNGNYMKEALESLEEDTFEFHLGDPLKPAIFKEGKYTHVIMPVKVP